METQVLPWVKNITKKTDDVFQPDVAPAHVACAGLVGSQHEHLDQRILVSTVTRFEAPRFQLVGTHWGKGLQDTPLQHIWAQGLCEPLKAIYEEWIRQKAPEELPTLIRVCYDRYVICYKSCLIWLELRYCRCLKVTK